MTWVLGVTTIGGLVVGALGIVVPYLAGKDEREHRERVARADRLHTELLAVYNDVLRLANRMATFVERTHPFSGPTPDPLELPSDEELNDITARVNVIGSEEALTALDELARMFDAFRFASGDLDHALAAPAEADLAGARTELDAARARFRAARDELGRVVRADLRA